MIKYSKFIDNIVSGNFTDTFCQNTDKFQKKGERWRFVTPSYTHTHTPAWHALGISYWNEMHVPYITYMFA